MNIQTAWTKVAWRNGLSAREARRLFPRVLAHALEHFEVVRRAVRQELSAAVERMTSAARVLVEAEVIVAMATFDEGATALLGGGL
jgi:hypothetical protein